MIRYTFAIFWLAGTALAQASQGASVIVPENQAPDTIHRRIPDSYAMGSSLERLIRFDPEGDQLNDIAIVRGNGDLTICQAPEVVPAFADPGASNVLDIARVPAPIASQYGYSATDMLLVANGTTLQKLTYDASLLGSATNPTGFVLSPLYSSPLPDWDGATILRTGYDHTVCCVVAVMSDLRTVRIGVVSGAGIMTIGTGTTGYDVKDLLFMKEGNNGQPQLVVRTTQGIEMWNLSGQALAAQNAPTAGNLGAICSFRDGGQQRLAWLAQDGMTWQLNIFAGATQVQGGMLTIPGTAPTRFLPLSLGAARLDPNSDTDALVLWQSSSETQPILTKNATSGDYEVEFAINVDDVTIFADHCNAEFGDMDHDGSPDLTVALQSQSQLVITPIQQGISSSGGTITVAASAPFDMLPVDCDFSHTAGPNSGLLLRLLIPDDYANAPVQLKAHVVVWHQFVACPTGNCAGGFGYLPPGPAIANHLFDITNEGLVKPQPTLDVNLNSTVGSWSEQDHIYIMIRLITQSSTGQVTFTTEAQMVAFVASPSLTGEHLKFLDTILTPQDPPKVQVHNGSDRNIGWILKPMHIDPPPSSVKPPAPTGGGGGASGSW